MSDREKSTEGGEPARHEAERLTVKEISGPSYMPRGLLLAFAVGYGAIRRHDIPGLFLGTIAGIILGESLWRELRHSYEQRFLNSTFSLPNRMMLLLQPIPFFILLCQVISLGFIVLAFQEQFLLTPFKRLPIGAWGRWADMMGGLSATMTLVVSIRQLFWTRSYQQTHGVDATYLVPPRRQQQPLSWRERLLLLSLILPLLITGLIYYMRQP